AAGVDHLQMMGVRYYMAFSQDAVAQARAAEGLAEIGSTALGPWVVFEVSGSAPAVGLSRLPVVVEHLDDSGDDWLEASVGAFLATGQDGPLLAARGPQDWPRVGLPDVRRGDEASGAELGRQEVMRRLSDALPGAAPTAAIEPAVVSNLSRLQHSISFTVDRVGSPVLVRTSYFPNWSVSGARGPYRVTPNFMVVVPTDNEVRLTYGRSGVEWFSMVVTLVGLAMAAWLILRRRQAPDVAPDVESDAAESSGAPEESAVRGEPGEPGEPAEP
ncbi:MAG: hypothetical protein OXC00_00415, partial [Acidimicrobiaceae bacterium]|nr:hypothetical protein [Acidimicrobiaceae bacterium]